VFSRGEIARALVEVVADRGGRLTLDDLAAYRVELRRPLLGTYRRYQVATMPPPGSGVTLLHLPGLAERLDLASLPPISAQRLHLELQAMRLALVDRAEVVGDPAHTPVRLDRLVEPAYLAGRRALILPHSLGPAPAPGSPRPDHTDPSQANAAHRESGETTHFVVVDRWGNLVSCTSTIEQFFGSGITVPGFGILLNNELADFDALPGGPNQVRPRARPASSMVPTLLLRDGRPFFTLGSPGGPTIVTAVFQVLTRLVDDRRSLAQAIELPRVFASRYPRFTWEEGVPAEVLADLRSLGHQPASHARPIGSVQAVLFDERGQPTGAADPRRDGAVIEVA
jgi:gamma-glutamyltranspeptidase/glutathione hydrolase